MTPEEFASRAVGLPWVRWRSDWQAADCYGLVILYHREVLGVDLGAVPKAGIGDGFEALSDRWHECSTDEPDAVVWMAWRDGSPTHCGIMLPGARCLHSEGRIDEHGRHVGSVRITPLRTMRRAYGTIRAYRYSLPNAINRP
jgi:cell wall-associated NlpC family hydrolase